MSAPIFDDRDEVLGLFGELDDQLRHLEVDATLTIVGGIWMLLTGRRAGTRDVDTITRLPDGAQTAVDLVAKRHGLPASWLNADAVFVMKLNRASPLDQEDLRSIWPDCTFEDETAAVQAFEAAYPNEEPDPHLVDWLVELLAR